jgi:hypothetical protein
MKMSSIILEFIKKQIYMKKDQNTLYGYLKFFFIIISKANLSFYCIKKKRPKTLLASLKVCKLENN